MTVYQPFERLPVDTYIGRETQKALLRQWSQIIAQEPRCVLLGFVAGGGLGKTRLLEHYPWLIKDDLPHLCSAGIIDLYDYESRSPDIIERKLIDGLKRIPNELPHIPLDQLEAAFAEHNRLYEEYIQVRGTPEEDQNYRQRLRESFVQGWNSFTEQYALAMCFDTIETLFSHPAPPEAVVNFSKTGTGAEMVLDWMLKVLPQLRHTLVLLSGRHFAKFFLDALEQATIGETPLLAAPIQHLEPFKDVEEAAWYLKQYDIPLKSIPIILQSTGGRPLLMACYAELGRMFPIPEEPAQQAQDQPNFSPERRMPLVRSSLEEALIEYILNPLRPELSMTNRTRVLSLYFLAYARRGIRRADLLALCQSRSEWLSSVDEEVIANLHNLAIVKERQFSHPAETEQSPTNSNEDTRYLFLHDEIQLLLDNHEHDEEVIEAKELVLDHLCAISKQLVQQAMRPAALLKTMADHLYYEMTRDIKQGYAMYQVYADWLIRERDIDEIILLSDVFWSTLNTSVHRHGRESFPYREALAESDLYEEDILYDQRVLQVKLLFAHDRNAEAMEQAEQLSQYLVEQGILPDDTTEPTPEQLGKLFYLYVDLNLQRAITTIQARPDVDEPLAEQIYPRLMRLLESIDTIPENATLMRLRRLYFLGQACLEQAFLRRQQQRFAEAEVVAELGRKAFRDYREKAGDGPWGESPAVVLNDRVDTEMAQITNNLAFVLAWSGNLRRALRLSNEVIRNFIHAVSDYRKALFYNTNGLIYLRFGRYEEAKFPLSQAEQAAQSSRINRARGMVAQALAQLARYEMKTNAIPDQSIEQHYVAAIKLMKQEPDALREIYFDQAGFARDISVLYRNQGDETSATRYQQQALYLIDETLVLLPDTPSIHLADYLQAKVSILNEMQRFDEAARLLDQIESQMDVMMPEYGQVVCGKIALQHAYLNIYGKQDYPQALHYIAIALARAYTFAHQHRDQLTFEQLIPQWCKDIPTPYMDTFKDAVESEHFYVAASDLPYQTPPISRWAEAWERSIDFLDTIGS